MIEIKEKNNCCGCTACASICPEECITMNEDAEGFQYPDIDQTKCIACGACEKVCPILNQKPEQNFYQNAYIVQNKDQKVLRESTAGGAFTAIARYILKHNGVVFGVELNDSFAARHIYVETEEDLVRFRNSKYVQSDIGGSTRLEKLSPS